MKSKTVSEIVSNAINDSVRHYFRNMASGQEKLQELEFLITLLSQQQLWLFFNTDSVENIQSQIMRNSANVNLIYNLTALFYSRLYIDDSEYSVFIKGIADSCDVSNRENDKLSFMPEEYRNRVMDSDSMISLMRNNRHLVMLICMTMYLDIGIFEEESK